MKPGQGHKPLLRASHSNPRWRVLLALCVAASPVLLASAPDASIAQSKDAGAIEVVQTDADLSHAMTRLPALRFESSRPANVPVVAVDDRVRYQRVTGFGGAMTDSSAWLLQDELSSADRASAMNDLFGARGIRLRFLRVPIGASDFTRNGRPYSYDDLPRGQTDPRLTHFSVAHDDAYVAPALRAALAIDKHVEILANPWSPPGWMKTNDSLNNRHHTGVLRESAFAPLARYFVKFIKAYRRRGIPVSALTPQNEPLNPTAYPGLQLSQAGEARFIVDYLRPALRRAGLHPKLYGGDTGYSQARSYETPLATGPARGSITGIAWHCYFGSPDVMSALHRAVPQLDQILDECAPGVQPLPVPEEVISAVRNWASAAALWCLALDPQHGPVQPPDHGCPGCTGLLTVDEHSHQFSRGITYFQLGQVSAFVAPGARRIRSKHFVSYAYHPGFGNGVTAGLDDVAFVNPDGSRVLVLYNNSAHAISFAVDWHHRYFSYKLAPQAMVTFRWKGTKAP